MKKRLNMIASLVLISILVTVCKNYGILSVFQNNARELPIYCVEAPDKKISISFDAAWGADYTQELLDTLEEYNVNATFFLVGFWAEKYPDMVKAIYARGHDVGNHSSSHPQMSKLSAEQVEKELTHTSDIIEKIIGEKTTLFRPPFGDYNNTLILKAKELGYETIQWDVDSLDYKNYGADNIVQKVKEKVKPGSIILFHNNADYTPQALPRLLDFFKQEGYTLVPISELIMKENFFIDHTGMQKQLK